MMILQKLDIERQRWGKDVGKLFGEITFDNQDAKVTIKLTEDQAYKMLGIVAEAVVVQAHETANLLISAMQRPQAEIEGEVQ